METMYERIKRMTKDEMKSFIYWVYMNGNEDGDIGCCDSELGYFGGHMLNRPVENVMPNDSVKDLWDNFNKVFNIE